MHIQSPYLQNFDYAFDGFLWQGYNRGDIFKVNDKTSQISKQLHTTWVSVHKREISECVHGTNQV